MLQASGLVSHTSTHCGLIFFYAIHLTFSINALRKTIEVWLNIFFKIIDISMEMINQNNENQLSMNFVLTRTVIEKLPCVRLARGKFELTNQNSPGGKKFIVITSM